MQSKALLGLPNHDVISDDHQPLPHRDIVAVPAQRLRAKAPMHIRLHFVLDGKICNVWVNWLSVRAS